MRNKYETKGDITVIYLKRKDGTTLETTISTSDLDKVNKFPNTWYALKDKTTNSFYVYGNSKQINGNREKIILHRYILDTPKEYVVDHIDRNTLNNTRQNLRNVTQAQNVQNRSSISKNHSGYRGVHWNKREKVWVAVVRINNNLIYLGRFKDKEQANEVVIGARKKYMPYSPEYVEG